MCARLLTALLKRTGQQKSVGYVIKDIDEQADNIYLRTDPLVGTSCLIQSYTQHVLKPHIGKQSKHQRFFLKSFYKQRY